MSLGDVSLRDLILVVVVVAAVYLVVLLLRLSQLSRRRPRFEHHEPLPDATPVATVSPLRQRGAAEPPVARALSAYADQAAAPAAAPVASYEWHEVKSLFEAAEQPPVAQATPSPPPLPTSSQRGGGFGESLAAHLARSEVEQEVQRMRDEMERMRKEMEELRTTQHVSPQYADASELARRGLSAHDIAERLGISLAEAELVKALRGRRQDFDKGESHGPERDNDEFEHRRTGGG